jgi:CHAD domain-containing protein
MNDHLPDTIDGGVTAEQALRKIIFDTCCAYDAHLSVVMGSDDPDGPRKTRVALRRIRSTLKAYRSLVRGKIYHGLMSQAKAIFRILGQLRDVDLAAETFPEDAAKTDRAARHADIRARVRDELRACGAIGFGGQLVAMTQSDSWMKAGSRHVAARMGSARSFGMWALGRAWDDCTAHGKHLEKMSEKRLHDLRKDLKTFRYLTEFFAPICRVPPAPEYLAALKQIQDELGAITDMATLHADKGIGKKARADLKVQEKRALATAARSWADLCAQPQWWIAPA